MVGTNTQSASAPAMTVNTFENAICFIEGISSPFATHFYFYFWNRSRPRTQAIKLLSSFPSPRCRPIPDRRTGHFFFLFVTGFLYRSTITCQPYRSRARSRIHKISQSIFSVCAQAVPSPPHCEGQDTEEQDNHVCKDALHAAVRSCRSMLQKP